MKLFKITNPLWVANLAPHIQKMLARITLPNIDYYALVTHYQHIAQVGGNGAEIFVVTEGESSVPIAFANWVLRGTPYIGTAYLEFIYSSKVGAAELLLLEFKKFAERNNSPFLMCDIGNDGKLIKHFRKIVGKYNIDIVEAPTVTFLAKT